MWKVDVGRGAVAGGDVNCTVRAGSLARGVGVGLWTEDAKDRRSSDLAIDGALAGVGAGVVACGTSLRRRSSSSMRLIMAWA